MATSLSAADKALHTSSEKVNFQRLARLLMCGGLTLLRDVFDSIHPPAYLPAVLSHPATVRQLNRARLTRAERDLLYLPTGGYGTSGDFDITLLFRLLRTVCHLDPPVTGWDSLPCNTDSSLEADLVRINIYRNSIYGHNHAMEISDTEFVHLWREISEALLRIAGVFGSAKRDEWKESIDKFQHDPLTSDAERYIAEFWLWYKEHKDRKDEVEKLRNELEQLNMKQEQMNIKQEQMNINIRTIDESIPKPGRRSITPSSGHFFNVPQLQETQLHFGEGMCAPKAVAPKQLQEAGLQPEGMCIGMQQRKVEGPVGLSAGELQTNQHPYTTAPSSYRILLRILLNPIGSCVGFLQFRILVGSYRIL